jgi:hypothetical protein
MSNSDFILRLSDGTTVIDLTPSFDSKVATEVIVSDARTKAGSLFRYKWADFNTYGFDLERVPFKDGRLVNDWHKNNSSLSLSFGTALDIDAKMYFPLDESSGALKYDLCNSYCLTFSNSPTIVAGLFGTGKAIQCSPLSSHWGSTTTPITGLTNGCDFWASMVFRFTDASSTLSSLISTFTYNHGSGDNSGFNLRYVVNSTYLVFRTGVQSADPTYNTASYYLAPSATYQAIITSVSKSVKVYIKNHTSNAPLAAVLSVSSLNINYWPNSTFLNVGKYSYDDAAYPFNGTIDDIRFGLQTLTDEDLAFLASYRMLNPLLPIKKPVLIVGDKSPFSEFDKPYLEYKGTLELEEI